MNKSMWILLISGLALLLGFQNCTKQGVKIDDLGSVKSSGDSSIDDNGGSNEPPGVDTLIANCADAKARGKLQKQTVQINFEDNMNQCPWGSGDNLSMKNNYVRSRIEQVETYQAPAGATVCQVTMDDLNQQNFRYDDNIIITLNDYVLASTTNFSPHFQASANGFYKYSWANLVDKIAQNSASDSAPANQYCAGASSGMASCLFPATETVGRVDVQFHEKVIQNILGITNASKLKLSMITTGDDDPSSDCHHTPVRFSVQVEYY